MLHTTKYAHLFKYKLAFKEEKKNFFSPIIDFILKQNSFHYFNFETIGRNDKLHKYFTRKKHCIIISLKFILLHASAMVNI